MVAGCQVRKRDDRRRLSPNDQQRIARVLAHLEWEPKHSKRGDGGSLNLVPVTPVTPDDAGFPYGLRIPPARANASTVSPTVTAVTRSRKAK